MSFRVYVLYKTSSSILKIFNPATGKIEGIKSDVSEAYGMFNVMLGCLMGKDADTFSAKAISREIDADNAKYRVNINSAAKKWLEEFFHSNNQQYQL